jgi:hypothetical protein
MMASFGFDDYRLETGAGEQARLYCPFGLRMLWPLSYELSLERIRTSDLAITK